MTSFTDQDKARAKSADPADYLEAKGFTVKREGRHITATLSDGTEIRSTLRPEGRWVSCDKTSNPIGDNIALIQYLEPGLGFQGAMAVLLDVYGRDLQPMATEPAQEKTPIVPPLEGVENGRDYLEKVRLISKGTIAEAERQGFIGYTKDGVLFKGYDSCGIVRCVTHRATGQGALVPKRDLMSSSKRYPQILKGESGDVWIVEGGMDALALHTMSTSRNKKPPTVIVSGGSQVRAFLENDEVLGLIRAASDVYICLENEANPEVQAKTDSQHEIQAEKILAATGKRAKFWKPKAPVKDLADLNAKMARK
jgi:hypothetical protein